MPITPYNQYLTLYGDMEIFNLPVSTEITYQPENEQWLIGDVIDLRDDRHTPLEQVELDMIAYPLDTIILTNKLPPNPEILGDNLQEDDTVISRKYYTPNPYGGFEIRELFECIEDFENVVRKHTDGRKKWFSNLEPHYTPNSGHTGVFTVVWDDAI